jgi:hypothetical protein
LSSDRLKEPLSAIVRGMLPAIDYFGLYRATVVRESIRGDGSMIVDVLPDDVLGVPRIPSMSGVRLKLGLPATTVQIVPGAHVGVGWEGGDPTKPFATTWDGGEADATQMTINAIQMFLGSQIGAEPTILGLSYRLAETSANTAIISAMSAVAGLTATWISDPTTITFTATYPGTSALLGGIAAACTALAAALTGFEAGAPAYLAKRVNVA